MFKPFFCSSFPVSSLSLPLLSVSLPPLPPFLRLSLQLRPLRLLPASLPLPPVGCRVNTSTPSRCSHEQTHTNTTPSSSLGSSLIVTTRTQRKCNFHSWLFELCARCHWRAHTHAHTHTDAPLSSIIQQIIRPLIARYPNYKMTWVCLRQRQEETKQHAFICFWGFCWTEVWQSDAWARTPTASCFWQDAHQHLKHAAYKEVKDAPDQGRSYAAVNDGRDPYVPPISLNWGRQWDKRPLPFHTTASYCWWMYSGFLIYWYIYVFHWDNLFLTWWLTWILLLGGNNALKRVMLRSSVQTFAWFVIFILVKA